jgi:hypothetical protein
MFGAGLGKEKQQENDSSSSWHQFVKAERNIMRKRRDSRRDGLGGSRR